LYKGSQGPVLRNGLCAGRQRGNRDLKMETIVEVTSANALEAGCVHSVSWIESHRGICTEEFLALHTPKHQKEWILSEMKEKGSRFFMLQDEVPIGIIAVTGSIIGHLYVIPSAQNKGYGTKLLKFAESQCASTPELWVRSTNTGAIRLYQRNGFVFTGSRQTLREGVLFVEEMRKPDCIEGEDVLQSED
ncbi:MAG: GNAT family N-acetyltransferase, partial [Spirochaetales bacterium]|nr:GNAT family N-acetyltransferase [Candidatus Physcosoma equi]